MTDNACSLPDTVPAAGRGLDTHVQGCSLVEVIAQTGREGHQEVPCSAGLSQTPSLGPLRSRGSLH